MNKPTCENPVKTSAAKLIVLGMLVFGGLVTGRAQSIDAAQQPGPIGAVLDDSKLEMIIWFMSSKQVSPVGVEAAKSISNKKSFINSGAVPNRILSRSFMKKAISYTSTIA